MGLGWGEFRGRARLSPHACVHCNLRKSCFLVVHLQLPNDWFSLLYKPRLPVQQDSANFFCCWTRLFILLLENHRFKKRSVMTNVTKVSHNGASMQLVRSGIHSKTTWLKHGRKTMLIKAIYAAYILILMHFLCILKNYFKKKLSSPARWQNATAHTHTDTGCDTKQESGSWTLVEECNWFSCSGPIVVVSLHCPNFDL